MFKFIGYNDGKDLIDKTFTFNGGERDFAPALSYIKTLRAKYVP